jgi:SAM-dependent methyltransferase
MDLSPVAVPPTLAGLTPLLPPPPARVLEVGCGRGALAAALAAQGYAVTGVDRDAAMAAAARDRGVSVVHADVRDIAGEYDVVLCTRSLHHAEHLADTLAHAATLLAPAGRLVVEEFAWDRMDAPTARFRHDHRARLVAAGLLDAELPAGDPLADWVRGHDFLHPGAAMLAALARIGDLTTVFTSMAWRLTDGRDGVWTGPAAAVAAALDAIRAAEERGIAEGALTPIGLLAAVRP